MRKNFIPRKKCGTISYFLKAIKLVPVSFSSKKRLSWGKGACVLNGNIAVGLGDHLILERLTGHDYQNVHYSFL